MSVTYFGVDMLTFNPVGSKESYKGNLLKKWCEMQAESSKRAEQALETYWGEEAKKNKTCPSNYSYYFVKETPGAARYQLIRDRSKSPDKTQVGAALVAAEKKEEKPATTSTSKPKKSPVKKKAKTKEPEPEKEALNCRLNVNGCISYLLAGLDRTQVSGKNLVGLPIKDVDGHIVGEIERAEGNTFYGYIDTETVPEIQYSFELKGEK
jgi:hypothetical protein